MKVVALISGGKDSCYNMLQCVMAGHEIVALANLKPESKDELDSFMYQTVGHQGVELYSEAMGIPLFRRPTAGVALHHDKLYTPTPQDEVEDLYQLLLNVKEEIEIEGVAVGAVLSDYQRLRVENVCGRLGLVALAYLWRRDQASLLQEMIDYDIDAIVIKVAALGLDPARHLGMRISQIQPHLVSMSEKYGLNICGEGGEYETFTLDCPLFSKSLVIENYETVIHSNDAIAPVGYINFRELQLVTKTGIYAETRLINRIKEYPQKSVEDYVADIDKEEITDRDAEERDGGLMTTHDNAHLPHVTVPLLEIKESEASPNRACAVANSGGWCWIGGVAGRSCDPAEATSLALRTLHKLLAENGLSGSDLVCVNVHVRDVGAYGAVNKAYSAGISEGLAPPPTRVCLGAGLHTASPVVLSACASSKPKTAMHVQALSHWAPANIGPYSQAARVGDIIYVAGQIGLVPGSMMLVEGGVKRECRLALRHVSRLLNAMDKDTQLRDIVQGVCYVTNASYICEVRKEWESRSNNAIVDYVVVAQLPRDAAVEWHVWAHRANTRFEYEETGCVVGENRVSIRRRWNYDNTVSAIVCYVSSVSSVSTPVVSELGGTCEALSQSHLLEVLHYAMSRLFKGAGSSEGACAVHVYYRVGRAPAPSVIAAAVAALTTVAATLVPVCQLNHPNTFLSLCAVRHE